EGACGACDRRLVVEESYQMKSHSPARSRKWAILLPGLLCGAAYGCSSGPGASPAPGTGASNDVASSYDALSSHIENCGNTFGACLESAKGDQTKNKACDADLQTCEA